MSIEEIYTQYQNFTLASGYKPNILIIHEDVANVLVEKHNKEVTFYIDPKGEVKCFDCKVIRSKDVDRKYLEFAIDVDGILNKYLPKKLHDVQR